MKLDLAAFDCNDHCTHAGIAAYHRAKYHPWRCRLFGHRWPLHLTGPRNGYSPHDTVRCLRGCWGHWYVVGQHRYGGLDREPVT